MKLSNSYEVRIPSFLSLFGRMHGTGTTYHFEAAALFLIPFQPSPTMNSTYGSARAKALTCMTNELAASSFFPMLRFATNISLYSYRQTSDGPDTYH